MSLAVIAVVATEIAHQQAAMAAHQRSRIANTWQQAFTSCAYCKSNAQRQTLCPNCGAPQ